MENSIEIASLRGASVWPGEDQIVLGVPQLSGYEAFLRLSPSVVDERSYGSLCQVDRTPAVLRFRLNQNQAYAALPLKSSANAQLALLQVKVIPHQAKGFAEPNTGCGKDHP
jgi:hypothetical protein